MTRSKSDSAPGVRNTVGGHLAVGVGVFIIKKELDVLGGYLSSRLVVDQLKRDIVGVYI